MRLGHRVRVMPAHYVRPLVKTNKNEVKSIISCMFYRNYRTLPGEIAWKVPFGESSPILREHPLLPDAVPNESEPDDLPHAVGTAVRRHRDGCRARRNQLTGEACTN